MSAPAFPVSRPARGGGLGDSLAAVAATYYWELRKLVAQKRSWIGIAAAAIIELVFLISIEISKVTPNDGPYADPMGHGLRQSGLALTPVVLKGIAYFGPAIIAALVGGDIVANEDGGGTLKTILVRSVRCGGSSQPKRSPSSPTSLSPSSFLRSPGSSPGRSPGASTRSRTSAVSASQPRMHSHSPSPRSRSTPSRRSRLPASAYCSPSSRDRVSPASSARSSTRSPCKGWPRYQRSRARDRTSSSPSCTPGTDPSRRQPTGL